MINDDLSRIFTNMADYLEMRNDVFRPIAYRRAGFTIREYPKDLGEVYLEGGKEALQKIPGIGDNIADKIIEYINTGEIAAYEKLKQKAPVNLEELNEVEGLGPKRIKALYEELGVKNLKDLEKAALTHRIAPIEGFGKKSEQNILENLKLRQAENRRWPIAEVKPVAEKIRAALQKVAAVKKIEIAGSLRREKSTIGDVDLIVVSDNSQAVMDAFVSLPVVEKVWNKGPTKASVRTRHGFDVDIRIVSEEAYGAAMVYFTGPKEHNIELRKLAIRKGYKLNEYGLFKADKRLAAATEADIYRELGLPYFEPAKRRDQV